MPNGGFDTRVSFQRKACVDFETGVSGMMEIRIDFCPSLLKTKNFFPTQLLVTYFWMKRNGSKNYTRRLYVSIQAI